MRILEGAGFVDVAMEPYNLPMDIAIGAMQLSALVYTASFFAISIACDYRYLYVLDIAAVTGCFYLVLDWHWPEAWLRRRFARPDDGRA